jgi:hypothetical protein
MLTVCDVSEHIKSWDEVYFLEYFGISTDDLVERFGDLIEEQYDKLEQEVAEEILQ